MSDMGRHIDRPASAPPGYRPASSLLLSMAAAILVTAVVFGSVGLVDRGSNRERRSPATGLAVPTPSPPVEASPSPSASAQPVTFPTTLPRPTVELRWTHGQSWVRIVDNEGVVVVNDIYDKGTVKKFTGPSFFVEMGNAGAITLIQKGGTPTIAGKVGETARWTVIGP